MKVVFAGGGTAGHINPALAIAQTVKMKNPNAEILFVGNKDSMEDSLVQRAGFPIKYIKIQGLNRKKLYKNVTTAKLLVKAVKDAKQILRNFRPDIVVGTGGYVSGPVLYAATALGIHTCIHEQNAYPGVTSKILSRRVEKVFISFENSKKYFKDQDKLLLTGNPLRPEFTTVDRAVARMELGLTNDDFYVLSFGGSLGAELLNRAMAEEMAMNQESGEFCQMHATGRFGWKWMPQLLFDKGIDVTKPSKNIKVAEYIYDMPRQIAAADVVISRAGAITLGELMAQSKTAILIPSPNVTHNHQYHNAMSLAEKGAAILIEEKDMTAKGLYETLLELKYDPYKRENLSHSAGAMALTDATEIIYQSMTELLR